MKVSYHGCPKKLYECDTKDNYWTFSALNFELLLDNLKFDEGNRFRIAGVITIMTPNCQILLRQAKIPQKTSKNIADISARLFMVTCNKSWVSNTQKLN